MNIWILERVWLIGVLVCIRTHLGVIDSWATRCLERNRWEDAAKEYQKGFSHRPETIRIAHADRRIVFARL